MKLYNLKDKKEERSFSEAVKLGLGNQQGLFFPKNLPTISCEKLSQLLDMNFLQRSSKLLSIFIGDEICNSDLTKQVQSAFSCTTPNITLITENIACLELFHGPTLAFKDFGARFMAQVISFLNHKENKTITILTATSGDTGAAVAHAFYKMKNVKVVILYPKGKISDLQEKLFCTLGENIVTISVNGSFDECQNLVKKTFQDDDLKKSIGLNSANSINISRLLAQICYYFEAFSLLTPQQKNNLIISVPCGNFGNITAGLLAKSLGLPIKSFIAATNANNTVPRFLQTGHWHPHSTISTLSNAMDISQPNNWPRVKELFKRKAWPLKKLKFGSVSEKSTKESLIDLKNKGYISEPHAAVAYNVLKNKIKKNEFGLFLGTAHPSKFKNTVEKILNINLSLPSELSRREKLPTFSHNISPNLCELKKFLLK
ncbi:MAG: threonine synthase [Buchnera aphidicola (Nurudea yanoniella)]